MLELPQVDLTQLEAIQNPEDRKTFVGNHIYQSIANAFGNEVAGRLTGMLLDENVVNFKQLLTDASYFSNMANQAFQMYSQQAMAQQ